ncbi:hypothetical protein IW152_004286 [Coemansia sp. BCRC 34962]|nr:hypothetical protein IW152_004286 [Coemansia sp. BCRC 34962]
MDFRDAFRRNVRKKPLSIPTTNPVYLSLDDIEQYEIELVVFRVIIVSDEFQGMPIHRRQHLVMDLLREELANSMATILILEAVAECMARNPDWTPSGALVPDEAPNGEQETASESMKKPRKKPRKRH